MNCLLKLNCLIRWHYAMQYLKYSEYYSNVTTIITRRIYNNLLKKYFRSHNSWQNLRYIYVISVSFFGGGREGEYVVGVSKYIVKHSVPCAALFKGL